MKHTSLFLLGLALTSISGCGGSVTSGDGGGNTTSSTSTGGTTGTGGATTGGTGGETGGTTVTTTSGGAGGTTVTTPECVAAADAIAKMTGGAGSACTSIVRLDYQTWTIKGWQMVCGGYAAVTEAQARATSQTDTGFGQNGQLLSGANPMDELVFYESPGDFGGVGVVSADTGLTVFGGGIVWSGTGQMTYPKTWLPPETLGAGCVPAAAPPGTRGWDLSGGMVMPVQDQQAAMDVVWGTALPDGLLKGGYLFDAVVLLYPPTVGVLDPTKAEWIVLLNSGWLE
ncbi:MAG: hypothetical protein U0441_06070 [Polyangiaceae bacterium]